MKPIHFPFHLFLFLSFSISCSSVDFMQKKKDKEGEIASESTIQNELNDDESIPVEINISDSPISENANESDPATNSAGGDEAANQETSANELIHTDAGYDDRNGYHSSDVEATAEFEARVDENESKHHCQTKKFPSHSKLQKPSSSSVSGQNKPSFAKDSKVKGPGIQVSGLNSEHSSICEGNFRGRKFMVTGAHNQLTLDHLDSPYIKVVGNQNQVTIDLKGEGDSGSLHGVCIFVAGNKNKVNVVVDGVNVEHIAFIGRGNLARMSVIVNDGAKVDKVSGSLAGHNPELKVSGAGDYSCEQSEMRGKNPTLVCTDKGLL